MKKLQECNVICVTQKCKVLVAGGGIAGISAALAAARAGAQVILVENSYILGGLATSGLVTIYLPICDGMGRQVSFGICEELLRLSMKYYPQKYPDAWVDGDDAEARKKQRFEVWFNPHMFALTAEKLLLEAGVEILYGTRICNVQKNNDKIKYVIVENKSGRTAIETDSVVDATGDADICHFAGEDMVNFRSGNTLAAWYNYISKGNLNIKMLGFAEIPEEKKEGKNIPLLVQQRFTGLNGSENSTMMQLAHEQMLRDIQKHHEEDETYIPVTLPTIPQLRMTRRVDGVATMDIADEHEYCETSIGMISSWRLRGPAYEVPFGALYGRTVKNLICAGRCISATETMWDISRVIGPCAVTGEAAGMAAALTNDFSALDIKVLQEKLRRAGVVLHEKDIL